MLIYDCTNIHTLILTQRLRLTRILTLTLRYYMLLLLVYRLLELYGLILIRTNI